MALMKHPVAGDKTCTMFLALVAAKVNALIANEHGRIADTIAAADAWMADWSARSGVPSSSAAWEEGEPLYGALDEYYNGELCAPSRDDLE